MNNNLAKYINRELSWIKFNERVLYQALDKKIPLLERIRFLSICFSNLDEFFMVRVAGLFVQQKSQNRSFDGLTPAQQLRLIRVETSKMIENIKSIWLQLSNDLKKITLLLSQKKVYRIQTKNIYIIIYQDQHLKF